MRMILTPARSFHFMVTLIAAMVLLGLCQVCPAAVRPAPNAAAQAYYDWHVSCLDGLKQDMPNFTASAEQAAERYVNQNNGISAMGDDGFTGEVSGRSGGIYAMRNSASADGKTVVMYDIREDKIADAAQKMAEIHKQGNLVIAFGRQTLLDAAKQAGGEWDFAIDTHAAPHGGLFRTKEGNWIIPTDPSASVTASWVWIAEFIGACTRLGKMPVVFEGYAVPGGMEWIKQFVNMKFHSEVPFKAEPGRYGRDFIRNMRKDLDAVFFSEEPNMQKVVALALQTQKAGKKVYTFVHGHCAMTHVGYPGDPGYFTQINHSWFDQKTNITIAPGDFIFCIGFDQTFQTGQFNNWTPSARAQGAKLAWSITDYNENPDCGIGTILPGEINVDQRWSLGDSVVNVPMHPVNICPTSGVLAEYVMWSTDAIMYDKLTGAVSVMNNPG